MSLFAQPPAPTGQQTQSNTETRQRELTQATIRRIAELRIKAMRLTCTVDEYIQRTQEQTAKAVR
jgi:hypothetical protein